MHTKQDLFHFIHTAHAQYRFVIDKDPFSLLYYINCSAVSPFLVGQNEWPMDHLLHTWSRVMADAMLSCLWWPYHSSFCHSSDPLFSSRRDSPRVQTVTRTNYMCLHVYWFAVVFCLLVLGVLQMNEL